MYDTDLNTLGVIEEISSLVWTRRYQKAGECNLLIPFREDYAALLQNGRLLLKHGGTEAMQVYSREISKNGQGADQIEVLGKTLMWWLDWRIALDRIISSGLSGRAIAQRLITENLISPANGNRRIPRLSLTVSAEEDAPIADYESEEHSSVLDCVESILQTAALGFRVQTSLKERLHRMDVFRGRNLTASQSENDACIFSTAFDTLGAHACTHGTEAYRSTAYVFGAEQTVTMGDEAAGLARREIAVEAGDIAQTYTDESGVEVTLSPGQLTNMLNQRGAEELQKALEELTFEGTLNPAGQMRYGHDFNIGDRVTCADRRWGISLDVNISEITETDQGNKSEIRLTFGSGTPTLRQTIRQISKR